MSTVVEKFDLSSLKLLTSGAAPLGPELSNQVGGEPDPSLLS